MEAQLINWKGVSDITPNYGSVESGVNTNRRSVASRNRNRSHVNTNDRKPSAEQKYSPFPSPKQDENEGNLESKYSLSEENCEGDMDVKLSQTGLPGLPSASSSNNSFVLNKQLSNDETLTPLKGIYKSSPNHRSAKNIDIPGKSNNDTNKSELAEKKVEIAMENTKWSLFPARKKSLNRAVSTPNRKKYTKTPDSGGSGKFSFAPAKSLINLLRRKSSALSAEISKKPSNSSITYEKDAFPDFLNTLYFDSIRILDSETSTTFDDRNGMYLRKAIVFACADHKIPPLVLMKRLLMTFNKNNVRTAERYVSRQVNVVRILKYWTTNFRSRDFLNSTSTELRDLYRKLYKKICDSDAIADFFETDLISMLPTSRQLFDAKKCPVLITSASRGNSALSPKEALEKSLLSVQFTIGAVSSFMAIEPGELIMQTWKKHPKKAPNVHDSIKHANHIVRWVQMSILDALEVSDRAVKIDQMVKMARRCFKNRDLHSTAAILTAINSSSIHGLSQSWKLTKQDTIYWLDRLNQMFQRRSNNKNLRELLNDYDTKMVPFLGMFLQDLVYIDDGNPAIRANGGINFARYDKFLKCFDMIKAHQRNRQAWQRTLTMHEWTYNKLCEEFHAIEGLKEDDLYDIYRMLRDSSEKTSRKLPLVDEEAEINICERATFESVIPGTSTRIAVGTTLALCSSAGSAWIAYEWWERRDIYWFTAATSSIGLTHILYLVVVWATNYEGNATKRGALNPKTHILPDDKGNSKSFRHKHFNLFLALIGLGVLRSAVRLNQTHRIFEDFYSTTSAVDLEFSRMRAVQVFFQSLPVSCVMMFACLVDGWLASEDIYIFSVMIANIVWNLSFIYKSSQETVFLRTQYILVIAFISFGTDFILRTGTALLVLSTFYILRTGGSTALGEESHVYVQYGLAYVCLLFLLELSYVVYEYRVNAKDRWRYRIKDKFLLLLKAIFLCSTSLVNFLPFMQYRASKFYVEQTLRMLFCCASVIVYTLLRPAFLDTGMDDTFVIFGIFGAILLLHLICFLRLHLTIRKFVGISEVNPNAVFNELASVTTYIPDYHHDGGSIRPGEFLRGSMLDASGLSLLLERSVAKTAIFPLAFNRLMTYRCARGILDLGTQINSSREGKSPIGKTGKTSPQLKRLFTNQKNVRMFNHNDQLLLPGKSTKSSLKDNRFSETAKIANISIPKSDLQFFGHQGCKIKLEENIYEDDEIELDTSTSSSKQHLGV